MTLKDELFVDDEDYLDTTPYQHKQLLYGELK
jgi:hypothetical protein